MPNVGNILDFVIHCMDVRKNYPEMEVFLTDIADVSYVHLSSDDKDYLFSSPFLGYCNHKYDSPLSKQKRGLTTSFLLLLYINIRACKSTPSASITYS